MENGYCSVRIKDKKYWNRKKNNRRRNPIYGCEAMLQNPCNMTFFTILLLFLLIG